MSNPGLERCTGAVTLVDAATVRPPERPEVEFPLSTAEAFRLAAWYCAYALDRLPSDARIFHTGVMSHGTSAQVQLNAVAELLEPRYDPVRPLIPRDDSPVNDEFDLDGAEPPGCADDLRVASLPERLER